MFTPPFLSTISITPQAKKSQAQKTHLSKFLYRLPPIQIFKGGFLEIFGKKIFWKKMVIFWTGRNWNYHFFQIFPVACDWQKIVKCFFCIKKT